jgi:hypothetical protein
MTSNPNEFGTSPQSRGGASPSIKLIDEDLSKIVTSLNGTTKGGDRLAFLLHNVLTPSQCDALIKRSEGIGYEAPRTGDVQLFEHECLHEGTMLEEGRKYVVRTDLMYTNKGRGHEYSNVGLYEGAETVAMDLDE